MREMRLLLVTLVLAGTCALASGQEFFENFDSYAAGTALHGVGGWKGWDNVASAGSPTSDKYAYSGDNSVEVVGTADLVHEFTLNGGRWIFSAMQYIPKGAVGSTYFILLNQYADGGAGNDWSIQLNFNLDTGVVMAEAEGGGATADIVYDRWVEQKFVIDLNANTCAWYYAGALVASHLWDGDGHTTLQAIDLYGNGASSVYYDDIRITANLQYKASDPEPADGAVGVFQPLFTWTKGETAQLHNVYLGTSPELTEADLVASKQKSALYYHMPGLEPGVTYYWRVDEVEADGQTIRIGDVWTFTAMPTNAFAAAPADGSEEVAQALTLTWQEPLTTAERRMYFGDSLDAVMAGDATVDKGTFADAEFDSGLLRSGTTYYWRVDVTDFAGAVQPGGVWSFTTGQPVTGKIVRQWWTDITGNAVSILTNDPRYPNSPTGAELVDLFEGPTDWKENYGSRLYGWLKPAKTGAYTFWIASDDLGELWLSTDMDPANAVLIARVNAYTASRVWTTEANQKSAPITLQAGEKYYIQALMKEGGGGDNIAVAWQPPDEAQVVIPGEFVDTFALPPLTAAMPAPENGAVDTAQSMILSWLAGEKAVEHDVYLGDDPAAVAAADTTSGLYQGRQSGTTFDAGDLEWGKTYYWRVDELADGDADSPWKGAVWSFTTADFLPVEDFESYDDDMDAGTAIFQTWIDGLENVTGSYVGYDLAAGGTFGETTIVHSGGQSMPLDYNNVDAPFYSETERFWPTTQDWTVNGVDTLTLYVRGKTTSDPAPLYVALKDSTGKLATVVHADEQLVTSPEWVEWNIPLSEFAGVSPARIKTMYIGIGDRDNPVTGGVGLVYIDDIRVTRP